jgi:metallo-beta-lactamase family protein
LTHAHVDHSGYLPALVRAGFRGRIWCTPSTADLAAILLPDSARLQEEDARFANKRHSSRHTPARPLFTEADAAAALEQLARAPFDAPFEPVPGVEVRLSRAGHILGAASARVDDGERSVLFSGDLGRSDDPVMAPPAPPPAADHLVVESTYGNRLHPDEDPSAVLEDIINRTVRRGGIVLVPVFAVGRAQTILHLLGQLRVAGRIPTVPTYLNSPMALDATELFLRSPGDHRLDRQQVAELCRGVRLVRTVEESKHVTSYRGPMVVLSASGMLTGGRVLHHLMQVAPDHRNTIVLAGFQAAGTRGEALLHGARALRVFGQDVPVRCKVVHLDSLSAHADADGLLAWIRSMPQPPAGVSVVHGEAAAAETLRRRIKHELGWAAGVPWRGDTRTVTAAPQARSRPPSTTSSPPGMYRDAGAARKTAAEAMSSGSPIRPRGIIFTNDAVIAAICSAVRPLPASGFDAPSVAMPPGAMALTRMPWGASSSASALVNIRMPPFDVS